MGPQRAAVLLGLGLGLSSPLWSEDLRPTFEVSTSFVFGQATELVLRDGTYNNPVSRLQWSIPPSMAVGLSVDWPWTPWTSTDLGVETLWPLTSGTMVDEDWNTGSASTDLIYGNSLSQGLLTSWWSTRWEQSFRWPPFSFLVGTLARRASWEAWGGTYHYQQVSGSTSTGSFSGLIVEYDQFWLIPYLGVGWTQNLGPVVIRPAVRWGPYAWGTSTDNHMLASNRKTFVDSDQGGQYGRADLEVELPGASAWTWGLRASWEVDWGAVGSTTTSIPSQDATSSSTSNNVAGDWFQEGSLTVFVRN